MFAEAAQQLKRSTHRESAMPMVTVEWIEGRSQAQKNALSGALTKAFVEIAKVSPEHVWVVFRDVKRSDWAIGGTPVAPR